MLKWSRAFYPVSEAGVGLKSLRIPVGIFTLVPISLIFALD